MMRLLSSLLLFLFLSASAHAVEPDEILKDPALESRARAISSGLRCLVCQNQSIDDSHAPLARDLRLLVRDRLLAGASDTEIRQYLVDRYGEFILLKPRFALDTILLWGVSVHGFNFERLSRLTCGATSRFSIRFRSAFDARGEGAT